MGCYITAPIVTEVEGDAPCEAVPFNFPVGGGETLFHFTNESFTRVLSALRNGAYYTYGAEGTQVIWEFLQNVECPMSFCEALINCLLNDDDTKQALAQTIIESPDVRRALEAAPAIGAPMGETQLSTSLSNSGCDLDVLFAEVRGLVDQLNTNNKDFLEIMSAASTPGKRLAQVIGAIPLLETLPVDEVVSYVSKLYDEIVTNYDAEWTTSVRDEYSCDLFCIARNNDDCTLSYDDIFQYFNERLGNAVSPDNLVGSIVQYTILGTWSGTVVIDIMMLNQIAIWRAASNWLGVSLRALQTVIALGGNIPDSDWEILCTDCPAEWEHTFELNGSSDGWTINVGTQQSDGIASTGSGTFPYTADISLDVTWPSGSELRRVRVGANSSTADAGAFRGIYYPLGGGSPQTGYQTETGDYEMDFTGTATTPSRLSVQVSNNSVAGSNKILYVTLNGIGDEPTW